MRLLALDHVQLAMPPGREAEARAFYAGLLGLAERDKPEHLRTRGGCWFEDGGIKVHLGVEEGFAPARKAHPPSWSTTSRASRRGWPVPATRPPPTSRSPATIASTSTTPSATASN